MPNCSNLGPLLKHHLPRSNPPQHAAQLSAAAGKKRVRNYIPLEARTILHKSFQADPNPDLDTRTLIAQATGLPLRSVQVSQALTL